MVGEAYADARVSGRRVRLNGEYIATQADWGLMARLLSSFFTDRAIYCAITVGDDLYIITLSYTDSGTLW